MIAAWVEQRDPLTLGSDREHLWVAALDRRGGLIDLKRVASGTPESVEVEVKAVLRVPLMIGAPRFVIAHNHPSQVLYPTAEDMALTRRIMEAASICGLVLTDHVILGPQGQEWSLLQHGLIEPEHAIAAKAAGRRA